MWARIEDGAVAELTDTDPAGRFHPDLVWTSLAGITPAPQVGWAAAEASGAWTFTAPPDRTAEIEHAAFLASAQAALDKSDMTAIRCWKAGVVFPAEWQDYDGKLRAIVNGSSSATVLPTRPAYPAGT